MPRPTVLLLAIFFVMVVVGTAADIGVLTVVGFFGVIAGLVVVAAAAGGDWIREASARRFRDRR
jgi:hypothetical protein